MMRRALGTAFGTAVAVVFFALGAGCTFLVSFDDVPQTDAGDAALDRTPGRDTGGPPDSGPAIPVMPACDTNFPLHEIKGCDTFLEGAQICADNQALTAYPGDRTKDVVACSKTQGATCVRHCVACARLPLGFPDQCDQCIGKPDGDYCGTDMGWQPENFRLLVTCKAERLSSATPCSTKGCDSMGGGGNAVCRP